MYHDADGNIISSETAIETHETINCSLYSREEFEDNTLLCLTLFDSKQRLAAINLDTVTPISNFYTLNLTVPEFIGEVEPDEVSYSKWSINITAVDGDNNYKPIMVNDSLVFN